MSEFDRWMMVDWSAASAPTTGSNSIWIADTDATVGPGPIQARLDNPATRSAALELVSERIDEDRHQRVLLGIDASMSLPRSGIEALLGPGKSWPNLWNLIHHHVTDQANNRNNRFEAAARINTLAGGPSGPFWGHPRGQVHPGLAATRPAMPWRGQAEEYRAAESLLRERGSRCPDKKSAWK